MTIEKCAERFGTDVHFEPHECELFMKLAADVAKASGADEASVRTSELPSYFSISVALGESMTKALKASNP